jgi:2'-5' RNA ligase
VRLFISINLPGPMVERIHRIARPLREAGLPVRWVVPENHHLTLAFLGEVSTDRIPVLEAAMARATTGEPPFSLALGRLGVAPTPHRPRVLWIEIDESPRLRRLHARLEEALSDSGFAREGRAFRPHLTLGRVRRKSRPQDFAGLPELAEGLDFADTFPVCSICLMRSELTGQGARYSVISRSQLTNIDPSAES